MHNILFLFMFRYSLAEEEYVEFSKLEQDKIIATNAQTATVRKINFKKVQMFNCCFINLSLYLSHRYMMLKLERN